MTEEVDKQIGKLNQFKNKCTQSMKSVCIVCKTTYFVTQVIKIVA